MHVNCNKTIFTFELIDALITSKLMCSLLLKFVCLKHALIAPVNLEVFEFILEPVLFVVKYYI